MSGPRATPIGGARGFAHDRATIAAGGDGPRRPRVSLSRLRPVGDPQPPPTSVTSSTRSPSVSEVSAC